MSGKAVNKTPEQGITGPSLHAHRSGPREYLGILLFAVSAFVLVCLVSYDPRDPSFNVVTARQEVSNLGGLAGSHIADALVQLLGLGALVVPLAMAVAAVRLLLPSRSPLTWTDALSLIILMSIVASLLERSAIGSVLGFAAEHPGGTIGTFLHASLFRFFGSAGELIVGLTLMLIALMKLLRVTLRSALRVTKLLLRVPVEAAIFGYTALKAVYTRRQEEKRRRLAESYQAGSVFPLSDDPLFRGEDEDGDHFCEEEESEKRTPSAPLWEKISFSSFRRVRPGERTDLADREEPPPSTDEQTESDSSRPVEGDLLTWKPLEVVTEAPKREVSQHTEKDLQRAIDEYLKEERARKKAARDKDSVNPKERAREEARSIRVARRADEELCCGSKRDSSDSLGDDYRLPPLDLLNTPPPASRSVDEKWLETNAGILEQKLGELGIRGNVVEIHPGPVITMYELILAPGIPLRKILNTSDDLAMALKSGSTRVVAPIPGKDTVGIEVPNLNREIVYLKEIIESPAFTELQAPLKVALGKGIDGQPFATSLARMPHLLIAGATGTGKSVGLNCLICSWLMSCHPDDVKFLMVDPKRLELSYYQDIPHLIHPVVTEPEKVPKVLSWAIREMERRYELLSRAGAKNIASYNGKVMSGEVAPDSEIPGSGKLPYLVIIVDELAELMMVAAKDIEISIARLAQMARAAGIHLILATQRPSVDVITGVIKANFPARVSFQVSARPDSRTILDTTGAENLLGMGDMLFLPPASSKLVRLHGAYLSEQEIKNIAEFIKAQRSPVYLKEIEKHVADDEAKSIPVDAVDDPKYDEAVELVTRLGHASISLIQRHMRIGYNRAARIIEGMEAEGLIGPSDGTSRPREVLARSLEAVPGSSSR